MILLSLVSEAGYLVCWYAALRSLAAGWVRFTAVMARKIKTTATIMMPAIYNQSFFMTPSFLQLPYIAPA
jgi:hypothetical protein